MDKILKMCLEIENCIPDNRIDGTFVGRSNKLYELLHKKIEVGWHICITGDIIYEHHSLLKYGIYYYTTVTPEIKKILLALLDDNIIETLYAFDENYNPMILIDDFPEDVTISIDIC